MIQRGRLPGDGASLSQVRAQMIAVQALGLTSGTTLFRLRSGQDPEQLLAGVVRIDGSKLREQ